MTLIADNLFIRKNELIPFEKGIRIDYILFKVGESLKLLNAVVFVFEILLVHMNILQTVNVFFCFVSF